MRYIVTGQEMKEYDSNTINQIGIPQLVLMERAALCVCDVIREQKIRGSILILCGVGNNGGDGLAAARILSERNFQVDVMILGDISKSSTGFQHQWKLLKHYPVKIYENPEVENSTLMKYDVILDALFGVGLSREVSGFYKDMIETINQCNAVKIAVDIPSGISSDDGRILGCALKADYTITFGYAKRGLYLYPGADYCGKIILGDIGINALAFNNKEPGMFTYDELPDELLPERNKDGNKGTFGKVLVVAGFEKMAGAAILCAKGALEMGAGMVKVISTGENRLVIQTGVPELLFGEYMDLTESMEWADVIVAGPGLGKGDLAYKSLITIFQSKKRPLILDADGLNLLSQSDELKNMVKNYGKPIIMTPHMGELARMAGISVTEAKEHRFEVAKRLAKEYHSIMVCKDARTGIVSENGPVYLNLSGNNGMATAGSGDVLAGIIAALYGQYRDGFKAACQGVYLHGLSGDYAKDKYTEYGVTAGRIIENIQAIYSK